MDKTLKLWLDELSEEIIVDHSPSIGEQASANMVTFSITEDNLKEWGRESIRDFILASRDLYESNSAGRSMLFYCWYDEQAGQLRFSSISSEHKMPPFQCDITYVELDFLIEKIFASNSGLFTEDKKLYLWSSNLR
ncbi:hypothetical protein [Candidatus Nitrotoga sp. M5]|uniref:hypothetical protein n=1 Tax=Candidatus Nitrotoga sp. M5 TaxID=2890409 RepID=UPI001EF39EED|nr:hypothetical protein [Candidatus Nitrotoga sp. M5]CAH1385460.1 conserved hypothetical protein [Candidatus Nitrotoga sp. M5]